MAPQFRAPRELVVTQGCCWVPGGNRIPEPHFEVDETYRIRQLVLDPSTGKILGELRALGGDAHVFDWDASGRHPLVAGERADPCFHVCPSRLFWVGESGRLFDLGVDIVDADW